MSRRLEEILAGMPSERRARIEQLVADRLSRTEAVAKPPARVVITWAWVGERARAALRRFFWPFGEGGR
jgi:hypothetical protein